MATEDTHQQANVELNIRYVGLFVPSIVMLLVGAGLLLLSFINVFLVSLLLELVVAIGLTALLVGRSFLSKTPTQKIAVGNIDSEWVRTVDIYSLLSIFDLLMIALFMELSRYSQYSQPVALFLMAVFMPIAYLGSFIFRDAYLALLDFKFGARASDPSVVIWVTSSFAKVLLKKDQERGVLYLRNAMVACKKLFAKADRYSKSLDEVIGFLNFVWETKLEIGFEKLAAYAERIFGSDTPKFELIPDESERFVDSFEWFAKTRSASEETRVHRIETIETIAKSIGTVLGGAGLVGGLVALSQLLGQSLSSIGPTLQAELPTVVVVITAMVILYYPLLRLKDLLGLYVRFSDLDVYKS